MTKQELMQIIKFDANGLIPVIVQDYHSKHIRMLAYMNKEALEKTLETGNIYYYSRSRNKLWLKGEESGHFQYLKKISVDCDGDTLLIQIEQKGNISCHTGNVSCFYRNIKINDNDIENKNVEQKILKDASFLVSLENIIKDRKENPVEGSYTNYLFREGINKILKKVGEEAAEIIIAAKTNKNDVIYEVSDLLYHLAVLLVELDISWSEIKTELEKR